MVLPPPPPARTKKLGDLDAEHLEIVGPPRRLDHLPVVTSCLKRLKLAEIIDERVADHPQRDLSTGACIEALIISILAGTHTLYRVGETLAPFDLTALLGAPFAPEKLSDNRIARALDAMFKAGLSSINAAAVLRTIAIFALDVSTVHFDTTSISVFGRYLQSLLGNPEDPDGVPHVTEGFSKDHRPDLKQVVYGLSVAGDGYVPLVGRVTDGNRSDSLETRFNITRLVETLPDPAKTLLVADSKQFSAENFVLANRHSLKLLCPLPVGTNAWGTAYDAVSAQHSEGLAGAPVLREKAMIRGTAVDESGVEYDLGERGDGEKHEWRGASVVVTHAYEEKVEGGKPVEHKISLKALVVRSSQLAEKKKHTLTRQRDKELKALLALGRKLGKVDFKCEADARRSALEELKELNKLHTSEVAVELVTKTLKFGRRGRPKRGEEAPTEQVHKVRLTHVVEQATFDERLARASCFVLVTQSASKLTDVELLETYKQQAGAEMAFRWTKGPAEIAPIFLETPSRIAALGLVYVFALMVYALVQRTLRKELARREATIPGNRGRTSKPTGEVLFRLLENIVAVPVRTADGTSKILIPEITTEQVAAFEFLGVDLLKREDVVTRIHEPRRGQRGFDGKGPFGRPRKNPPKRPRKRGRRRASDGD